MLASFVVETRGGRTKAIREFLYGMFGYEHAQQALEIRASVESLFMLLTFGDMIGVPVMPPYYSLRLLLSCCGRTRIPAHFLRLELPAVRGAMQMH